MLLGVGTSCPGAIPVPESDTVRLASEALLDNAMVPVTLLAADGVKTKFKLAIWPGEIVNGSIGALSEKSEVLARALVIVTELVPVLVAETVSVLLLPTTTLPNPRAALLNCKSPIEAVC